MWSRPDHPTIDPGRAGRHPRQLAASVWEIEIKRTIGKLDAPDGLVEAIESAGFGSIPITLADAERAGRLPAHLRDPLDRMLVAQATRLDAVIVTRDPAFGAYGVETLTA